MPYVIDELAQEEEALTEPHVRRRLSDWEQRIDDLYALFSEWLPQGLSTAISGTVPMNEKVMQLFQIAEVKLPILRICHQDGIFARIVPYALWIVGTNGRLDLIVGDRRFIIVDRAENFAAPAWEMASSLDQLRYRPLDRSTFLEALSL